MGENDRALIAKILVSARVIVMPVRVDEIFDRSRAESSNGSLDLGRQRRELVIYDDRRILAIADSDVTALAKKDGNTRRDDFSLDLDCIEIALCLRRHCEKRQAKRQGNRCKSAHGKYPPGTELTAGYQALNRLAPESVF